jgi:hypothetical protein
MQAQANQAPPPQAAAADAAKRTPFRWGFLSSLAVLLVLTFSGQALIALLRPAFMAGKAAYIAQGPLALLSPGVYFGALSEGPGGLLRPALLGLFLAASAVWTWSNRAAVQRYFTAMHTGVVTVSLSLLAVAAGVMIPQIDPVDDPDARVMAAEAPRSNYEQHYQQFRFAQSYFLWHLLHLYGFGMPEGEIPPQAVAGLERRADRYGSEEAMNTEKQMRAAIAGQQKGQLIEEFAERNDRALRACFDFSTRFELNRIYRSYWFASLMSCLFVAIAFNTFKGGPQRWFKVQKLGFFLVHVGMLILLTGGGLSRSCTERGIMHLYKGGLDEERDGVYDRRDGDIPPIEDTFYEHFTADRMARMPFGVSLEDFARRDWLALVVRFNDDQGRANPPTHTLWKGRRIDLDYEYLDKQGRVLEIDAEGDPIDAAGRKLERQRLEKRPRLRIEVLSLHDLAQVGEPTVREAQPGERPDGEEPLPLAILVLPDYQRILSSAQPGPGDQLPARKVYFSPAAGEEFEVRGFADPLGAFRLLTVAGGDPREAFPTSEGQLGEISYRIATGGERLEGRLLVSIGQREKLPGGYEILFQKATKSYREDPVSGQVLADERPLAEQVFVAPAVTATLYGPDGVSELRVLHDGRPSARQRSREAPQALEAVELTLEWNEWSAPGPPRFVLGWSRSAGGELSAYLEDEAGQRQAASLGARLPLPGLSPIQLESALLDAVVEPRVEFLDEGVVKGPGYDPDFYKQAPRGVELRVISDPEVPELRREQTVRLATTQEGNAAFWFPPRGDLVVQFIENQAMMPFEWRSVLAVHEPAADGTWKPVDLGPAAGREIRVNDYFQHRGFRFFQTNAIPEAPLYSGIGVVYDPGIPWVLAGMYTVIAGAAFAFLLRPILLGRNPERPSA